MSTITRTERGLSQRSDEYLWDVEGLTEVHGHVLEPVARVLRSCGAQRVLDIGCGNGAFTAALRDHGYEMAGLDHSASGIELARRRYPAIEFAQFDVVNQTLPASHVNRFDTVVAIEVIEHLLLPRRLLHAAAAALRPGGALVLTTPFHGYWKNLALAITNGFDAHWHPLRDFGHVKFFSRATILALMEECGFGGLRVETAGRIPPLARSMIVSGFRNS